MTSENLLHIFHNKTINAKNRKKYKSQRDKMIVSKNPIHRSHPKIQKGKND